jgi:putative hydrolase of the HAD superfamily
VALGRVDAVLLDSFGTLVSMEPPGPRLAASLGVPLEAAERAFRAEIAYYVDHHLDGRDPASLSLLRDRCASVVRESLGLPTLDLQTARRAMLDAIRFSAYPDAAPALRELRARGMRLVVASNWDCSLPEVLEQAGLASLVDGVVASATVGAAKPGPALFEAALAIAGSAAARAVHVGDSLSKDVAGAARAGIAAVFVDREGGAVTGPGTEAHTPAATIASLAELPGLI